MSINLMHRNVKRNTNMLAAATAPRETLAVTSQLCQQPTTRETTRAFPSSTCSHRHAGVGAQRHYKVSVMCKKTGRGRGEVSVIRLLLDLIGGSHGGADLHFCWREKWRNQENLCFFCSFSFFVGHVGLFTWARSTFQDNVINGNIAPYWRTPDGLKHNLGHKQTEV